MESTSQEFHKIYKIDDDEYEEILDLMLVSQPDGLYRCDVACKVKNTTSVLIWDLCTLVDDSQRDFLFYDPKYKIDKRRQIYFIQKDY